MTDYGRTPEWYNPEYNIHVWDEGRDIMPTYYLEQMGNDDEYAMVRAWCDLFQWMQHKHSYDPKTQELCVYNIRETLDHKGKINVDYDITGTTIYDQPLYCKRSQLAIGDEILSVGKMNVNTRTLKEGDEWLMPCDDMGYFRYWITGGSKFEAWKDSAEQVAKYIKSSREWHWKATS